jgi:hypothetical protein
VAPKFRITLRKDCENKARAKFREDLNFIRVDTEQAREEDFSLVARQSPGRTAFQCIGLLHAEVRDLATPDR